MLLTVEPITRQSSGVGIVFFCGDFIRLSIVNAYPARSILLLISSSRAPQGEKLGEINPFSIVLGVDRIVLAFPMVLGDKEILPLSLHPEFSRFRIQPA